MKNPYCRSNAPFVERSVIYLTNREIDRKNMTTPNIGISPFVHWENGHLMKSTT